MSVAGAARRVVRLLARLDRKVVFAESCTGGLVSGSLTAIAGVSAYHCGGVVVYRNATKAAYLQIPKRVLDDPGPVSRAVAQQMAQRVLRKTPEADIAVSVTGHLGPEAPRELDGQVYVGVARRLARGKSRATSETHSLSCQQIRGRAPRQWWVVEQVLGVLASALETAAAQTGSGRPEK